MIFVATSAERLTMNHRDESDYMGTAPSHPEEAAAHGPVSSQAQRVRVCEGEYQKQVSADPKLALLRFRGSEPITTASTKAMELEPYSRNLSQELAIERYRVRFRAAVLLETQQRDSGITLRLD
jgi:hypothetical protein